MLQSSIIPLSRFSGTFFVQTKTGDNVNDAEQAPRIQAAERFADRVQSYEMVADGNLVYGKFRALSVDNTVPPQSKELDVFGALVGSVPFTYNPFDLREELKVSNREHQFTPIARAAAQALSGHTIPEAAEVRYIATA